MARILSLLEHSLAAIYFLLNYLTPDVRRSIRSLTQSLWAGTLKPPHQTGAACRRSKRRRC
jgi:hypothetical protein